MAVLGLRFCVRAFSSCGKRGPLLIAVRGPLTIAASPVAEHRLQTRRLSNCGSRAQPLRGMWDLPRPGPEPMYPALAGRFSTTAPPGKPKQRLLNIEELRIPPQASISGNVKGSPSSRRKPKPDGNLNLHKGMRHTCKYNKFFLIFNHFKR